jgi:uncharacterized protein (DUF305 family)
MSTITRKLFISVSLCLGTLISSSALADGPGRGLTARFEINFMQFTIDHHFAALRITELAAGTDTRRNGDLSPAEGTSPTPGFGSTQAKASLDDLKSLARRANRMQREEILTLKRFLHDWYGIDYQPRVRPQAQPMVQALERARPGADFNHAFLEVFSRHHYTLMEPASGCMSGADRLHESLRRQCRSMLQSQAADIEMMRAELERHFGITDYQPFVGDEPLHPRSRDPNGQHSGH